MPGNAVANISQRHRQSSASSVAARPFHCRCATAPAAWRPDTPVNGTAARRRRLASYPTRLFTSSRGPFAPVRSTRQVS